MSGWASVLKLVFVAAVLWGGCGSLKAQIVMAAPVVEGASSEEVLQNGFQLGVDESLQSVVEDFQRYARRGLWEKAIEVIESVEQDKLDNALLVAEDGFVLPAGDTIWRLQASLSGEFRQAFRVFLDAKARKVFSEAVSNGVSQDDLQAVYRSFFVTSVGDDAANLLGDAAFRDGNFRQAIIYWQQVLDYHPDSQLPIARVVTKIGLAAVAVKDVRLARESLTTLRERYADETVTLAGESRPAVDVLSGAIASLDVSSGGDDDAVSGKVEETLEQLPEKLTVRWRHELVSKELLGQIQAAEQGYWNFKGARNWVVPVDVFEDRLAYNYYGVVSGLDLKTGKLLWREGDQKEVTQQIAGDMYELTLAAYGVRCSGGLAVARHIRPECINYWRVGADLQAFDMKTGKKAFGVGDGNCGQDDWYHIGEPLIAPPAPDAENKKSAVYTFALKESGSELFLRRHDGRSKSSWELSLGSYRDINLEDYYNKVIPKPRVLGWAGAKQLVLMLDEGAIVAIDVNKKAISWAYRYQANSLGSNNNNVNRGVSAKTTLHPGSSALLDGSIVYVKDTARPHLVALDIAGQKKLWARETAAMSEIVARDEKHLYLLGEELLALDRETGDLVWASRLPMQAGGLSAVTVGNSIVVFTGRGLFELNRHDGSVVRIHRDINTKSNGGRVFVHQGRLYTVSSQYITAWNTDVQTEDAL